MLRGLEADGDLELKKLFVRRFCRKYNTAEKSLVELLTEEGLLLLLVCNAVGVKLLQGLLLLLLRQLRGLQKLLLLLRRQLLQMLLLRHRQLR